MAMRNIEYLIQLYPNKTGKQLLAIQEQDKIDDEKQFRKAHKKTLAFMEDINSNGGYFRGKFGLDQYYYYRVYNMTMNDAIVYMDVESVVMFSGAKRSVIGEGNFSIERNTKTFQKMDTYALDSRELCERVTVKEWDEMIKYFEAAPTKFW
jgi:hypothetical protein